MNLLIDNKYRLGTKIGSGSFGDVYIGINIITQEKVAIKLQKNDKCLYRTAENEQKALEVLKKVMAFLVLEYGFPRVRYFAKLTTYTVLVFDLLGPTLEEVLVFCDKTFSQFTTAFIGEQILMRIQSLHIKGYIHRDIKPENFLFGLKENCETIYMIDLGLSKKYLVKKDHIPFLKNKSFVGTARFSSPSIHNGYELSRRDDLVSFCYMLIYLKKGKLPWQGVKAENKTQKMEKIKEIKNKTSLEQLCNKTHFAFYYMIKYCQNLVFNETPNYLEIEKYLKELKLTAFPQFLLKLPIFINDWCLYRVSDKHNEFLYKKISDLNSTSNSDSENWANELMKKHISQSSAETCVDDKDILIGLVADRSAAIAKNPRLKDFLLSSFKNLPKESLYCINTVKKLKLIDVKHFNSKVNL